MTQSLSKCYIHIIYSTKYRSEMIRPEIEPELYRYMSKVFLEYKCPIIEINSVTDHIHILCSLARTISLSKLIERSKTSSSKWIKTKGSEYSNFSWQNGYGGFSVSPSAVRNVQKYVRNQKAHHNQESFKDEFVRFLQRYEIEYDDKYLWD